MPWTTPPTHNVGEPLTASDWNIAANDLTYLYNFMNAGTGGTTGTIVATSETTTSTGFTGLTTAGPIVTVTTGYNAIVILTANISTTVSGSIGYMGYDVSGGSTISAAASKSIQFGTNNVANVIQCSSIFLSTGLTPGSNTFTAKYRTSVSGSSTFSNRNLIVIPLP